MADEQSAASPRKPLGRSAESLGWLASSGVQPKKRKEIQGELPSLPPPSARPLARPPTNHWLPAERAGVSAASLVALKAEMYKAQQEAALVREGKLDGEQLRARRRGGSGLAAVTQRGNAGVAERDRRDRLELKTTSQRMSEAAAALERKAQLYDRLARGEAEASGGEYEVDFLLKQQHPIDTAGLAAGSRGGSLVSSDMAQERRRREWEEDVTVGLADEEARERKREGGRQVMGGGWLS